MPTLKDLFTWEYVQAHWLGLLVVLLITIFILWRWSIAGKESGEGPVAYAKRKHQFVFFVIGILTAMALVLIIAFVGPQLIKFTVWGLNKAVANSESVVSGTTSSTNTTVASSPTADQNFSNFALPTTTASAQTNTNPASNLYTVTLADGATTRDPGTNGACDDNDDELGSIPFGTVVTITGTWPSYNIPGQRGLTTTGVCVHLSALTQK